MSSRSLQLIRNKIQSLLKDSPYVSGWLFEHAGASTLAAVTAYRMRVADANVCAFIIDGRYEIPEGVQEEIDEAARRHKKCLYYFYKISHEGPRKLRDGLRGPNNPKYCEVKKLGDIPSQLQQDVVEEVFLVYRHYAESDVILSQDSNTPALYPMPDDAFVNRSSLVGFPACTTFINNFILGNESIAVSDDELDKAAAGFFEAVYIKAAPHTLRLSTMLTALKSHLPSRFYPTIELRWHAIHQYYLNDLPAALAFEEQALNSARTNRLPEWFVDDILIDLRNLQAEVDAERNVIWQPSSYQTEIDGRNREIQLPLVDRMSANLLESMLAKELKSRVQSSYVITLGSQSTEWVGMLVKLYVATVHYGSLTHMLLLARRMRLVASFIWQTTGKRAAILSELKLALVTDNEKNVQSFLGTNSQPLGCLTCEEADAAFLFAWDAASGYRRNEARVTALAMLAPFLSDAAFSNALIEAQHLIVELLESTPIPPSSLNHMLSQCAPREMPLWMVNLTVDSLDKGPNTYWAREALRFLSSGAIRQVTLSCAHARAIAAALGRHAASEKADKDELIRAFGGMGTLILEHADWLTSFTDGLSDEQKTSLAIALNRLDDKLVGHLLQESLERIRSANLTQGVGGVWSGGRDYYQTAERVLSRYSQPSFDYLQNLAISCAETLVAARQTTDAKWGACLLLLFLLGKAPRLLQDEPLLDLLRSFEGGKLMSTSLFPLAAYSEDNARIACIAVQEVYGIIETGSFRLALLDKRWGNPGELGRLTKLLGHLVSKDLWGRIGDNTISCALEFLLSLTSHESNEVRGAAIDAIIPMAKHPVHARTTCATLTRVFASSHPWSKLAILDAVECGGAFNLDERRSIIQTASRSSCYYVRMRIEGRQT